MRSTLLSLLLGLGLGVLWFHEFLPGDRALLGIHPSQYPPLESAVAPAVEAQARASARPLFGDKLLQHHPEVVHTVQTVRGGSLPAWNPWVLGGLPHLATGLPSAAYPPLWLAFWIDPPGCYAWVALLQVMLATWFFAGMLEAMGLRRFAALSGGMLFSASGWMSVHQEYFQLTAPAIWLPLVLWGTLRVAQGEGGFARVGLGIGLAFLSGFPQIAVYHLVAAAMLGLLLVGDRWRCGEDPASRAGGRLIALALAVLLGLMLASPQLLPTAEFVGEGLSTREALEESTIEDHALPPGALLGALCGTLLGSPDFDATLEGPVRQSFFGVLWADTLDAANNTNFFERSFFLGPCLLLFALVGLLMRRRIPVLFFALLTLTGLLLALPGPVQRLCAHLPGLNIGDPKRALFLVSAGIVALAAHGIDVVARARFRGLVVASALAAAAGVTSVWGLRQVAQTSPESFRSALAGRLAARPELQALHPDLNAEAVLAALPAADFDRHQSLLQAELLWTTVPPFALLVLGLALLWLRRQAAAPETEPEEAAPEPGSVRGWRVTPEHLLGASLWVVCGVPLWHHWQAVTRPQPTAGLGSPGELLARMQADPAAGRLLRFATADEASAPLPPAFLSFLPSKLPMLHGVADAQGYVAVFLKRYRELFEALAPGSTESVAIYPLRPLELLARPLLDALNVRFAVAPGAAGSTAGFPTPAGWSRIEHPGGEFQGTPYDVLCLRNDEALGRGYLVSRIRALGSDREVLRALTSPDFAAATEALVLAAEYDGPLELGRPPEAPALAPLPFESRLEAPVRQECTLVEATASELHFDVQSGGALLVQSDCIYPGWKVQVDGQDHPLLRVNHCMRGVLLAPGSHRVRFYYRPMPLYLGLCLFPLALGCLLTISVSQRSRRKTHP